MISIVPLFWPRRLAFGLIVLVGTREFGLYLYGRSGIAELWLGHRKWHWTAPWNVTRRLP